MKNIFLFTHRRSGSHFLRSTLTRNFQISIGFRHFEFDNPDLKPEHRDEPENHPILNLVRDGRDVMVACYHYYSMQDSKGFPNQIFKDLSFKDFIRGNYDHPEASEIKFQHWTNLMFDDPIQYWVDFVSGWLHRGTAVRFEDLKLRGEETIKKIQHKFDLEMLPGVYHIQEVNELVGPFPRKGIVGDWMNYFDEDDLEFFWSKAGNLMEKLDYKG